jgi:hypothetical protein
MHSACDGARAKSPKRLLGGSTAQLQIPFTLLTTLLKGSRMPDMSSRRHERIQATASSLRCACPLASASPPTPLNQFDILRGALHRMRLNIAFLRHITISQVVECDMRLQAPICVDSGCFSSSKLAGSCNFQRHLSRVAPALSVKTILLLYHRVRHRFQI